MLIDKDRARHIAHVLINNPDVKYLPVVTILTLFGLNYCDHPTENLNITETTAKRILKIMIDTNCFEISDIYKIIAEHNWTMLVERNELEPIIDDVLRQHPSEVVRYRAGKTSLLHFFLGQIMRATEDRAQPAETKALLLEKLS